MTGQQDHSAEAEALARYRSVARRRRSQGPQAAARGQRNPETGASGRDPVPLGEVWQQLAGGRGWSEEIAIWSLAHRWHEIVGAQVAEHVSVLDFDPRRCEDPQRSGGLLTLQADSNAWQQQLIWNLPHLQRRLDTELGRGVVGKIVVLGPSRRSRRWGPRRD